MTVAGAEVVIEKLIPDGKALGRLADGRVVIASGPVPGDRIALESVTESKGLVTVRRFRLLAPSPGRIAPSCPFAERCGGCDWMVLPVAEQRRQKLEILKEALRRTGKIDWGGPLELVAGEAAEGYRGRVRLQVGAGRVGFYHRASHELIEPDVCRVSTARVNAALGAVRELARLHPDALPAFAWLEVREATDGSISILLEPAPGAAPARGAVRAWLEALRQRYVVAVRGEPSAPEQWQRFDLTDHSYLLSAPAGFVQVNWEVNRRLIADVVAGAAARGVHTFLDAYAGSGNFTLPLLAGGLRGLAVESNASAVAPLIEAARRQGFDAAEIVVADAGRHARALARAGRGFDLVLVDPPRAGLGDGLEPLSALARGWLAMCSCNPVTLARDLRRLLERGFELEALRAFDMFPQTHHVEALAWLRAPRAAQMTAQMNESV